MQKTEESKLDFACKQLTYSTWPNSLKAISSFTQVRVFQPLDFLPIAKLNAILVDQQSLLDDKDRLEELRRSYDGEARLNESFIVLTVGASLIASLGLVADNMR